MGFLRRAIVGRCPGASSARSPRQNVAMPPIAFALALAALAGSVVLAGCGDDPDPVASDPTPTAEPTSPPATTEPTDEPTDEPTTEPEPSEPTGAPETVAEGRAAGARENTGRHRDRRRGGHHQRKGFAIGARHPQQGW